MELLRFITAGSVDDGKSTLIGRMLYDAGALLRDQVAVLEDPAKRLPDGSPNFALLTDGLRAEREQGITIDVAYKYFNTRKRKFIIADTPGHVQYTRNMVTGASTANLAIILVDARQGVLEQTRRHSLLASLVQIPHLVVVINKMDLAGWSEETFERIRAEYNAFAARLDIKDVTFIPVSAQLGDNVVNRSANMPWYGGPTLLSHLETVHVGGDRNLTDARFPVQLVIRPQDEAHHDYRAYAGQVASGIFRVGDEVEVLPSGLRSKIVGIDFGNQSLQEAFAPQSVAIRLEHDIDISRGDMLVKAEARPHVAKELQAWVVWLDTTPARPRGKYLLRHGSREVKAMLDGIDFQVDVNSFERIADAPQLGLNGIARTRLKLATPIFFDDYRRNRANGSFILVDESTHLTVGAGILLDPGSSGGAGSQLLGQQIDFGSDGQGI